MISQEALSALITDKPAIVTRRVMPDGRVRFERVPIKPDGQIEVDTSRPDEFLRFDVK